MRKTRILLLRHAETAAPDRFHGAESDIALGAAGQIQATAIARRLAPLAPQALYCSGMLRARETAESIGRECNLVPRVIEALHERRMGPLSGQLKSEGWTSYQETMTSWMSGDLDSTHEGGESYLDMARRTVPILQTIADQHQDETVVVVAHGVVIRVLVTSLVERFGPADFNSIPIEFVAVTDLRWNGLRWEVVPFE